MADWSVLDLPGDPTPGDAERVTALGRSLLAQAELILQGTENLAGISARDGDLRMEGDYAPAFRQVLADLPGELAKLKTAYDGCGYALTSFADTLRIAQDESAAALRAGAQADEVYRESVRTINSLSPVGSWTSDLGDFGTDMVEMLSVGADATTHEQISQAVANARYARADRDQARRLALEAQRLRNDAEVICENAITATLNNSGIANKSFWRKAMDFVTAPFRSWHSFVKLCGYVAGIAGIVLLFVSNPILLGVFLVAGGVGLADSIIKYVNHQGSLSDVIWSGLNMIPGGRDLRAGKDLAGVAEDIRAGGGKDAVGALLHHDSGSIRHGIDDVTHSAQELPTRTVVGDPVDVATGEMTLPHTDLRLPGVLPLVLDRVYLSGYRAGRAFGAGWASTLDQRLDVDAVNVFYAGADGVLLLYPLPTGTDPVYPEEGPRRALTATADGYAITDAALGRTLHFTAVTAEATSLPLTKIVDRYGNRIDLRYTDDGELNEIRHCGGSSVGVTSTGGRITALDLVDPAGRVTPVTSYRYDEDGRLTDVVNSSGRAARFAYGDDGRMASWTDRNGVTYLYEYDDDGRCVRNTGAGGDLSGTFAYVRDDATALTTVTDSLGHVTTFHLNDDLQIVAETDPLGHTVSSTWSGYDRLASRTDALGHTTRFAYDDAGNIVRVTHPDGSVLTAEYDAAGQPVVVTDEGGAVWRNSYDRRGARLSATDPLGATTRYAYDERGAVVEIVDPVGGRTVLRVDASGLPVERVDPAGAVTRVSRDGFGRIVESIDESGAVTRFDWTVEGAPARTVHPDGAVERWTYDGEGNVIAYVDPLGRITRTEMTGFDLVRSTTAPDGSRTRFGYDTQLRLVSVTNPQGREWTYRYDPAGRLVGETDFNGRALSYRHDPAGRLTSITNGAGETTEFEHDTAGNVIRRRAGTEVTELAYDPAGHLLRAANRDAVVTFARDPLGRATSEDCNGRVITYGYDPLGRRTERLTPSGVRSTWRYDAAGRPVTLETGSRTVTFGYDATHRETSRSFGASTILTQTWDQRGRLRTQDLATRPPDLVQQRSYDYRADGLLTRVADRLAGTRRIEVDELGRVTAVDGPGWTEQYAYDTAGNITYGAWPAGPRPDADTRGDREITGSVTRRAGNVRYEYDQQGRVILRQQKQRSTRPWTWRYSWNAEDRLTGVVLPDGRRWEYRYDAFGRRIAKLCLDEDGTVVDRTDFTWDGMVLAEQHRTAPATEQRVTTWDWEIDAPRPVTQTERTYGPEAPQSWVDERFFAIVTDLIGTPAELVDESGAIAWRSEATLWGSTRPDAATTTCPLRFPGQYFDGETRLHYNVFRYFDPADGRYLSADPLGLEGGAHPYAYVPNPTVLIDPLGLTPCAGLAAGTNANGQRILFHYTNEAGHNGIVGDQKLLPSIRGTVRPRDATFGNGQYLTHITPGSKSGKELAMLLVHDPRQAERFTHYVAIDVTGLDVKLGRPYVYVIRGDAPLDLSGRIVSSGVNR